MHCPTFLHLTPDLEQHLRYYCNNAGDDNTILSNCSATPSVKRLKNLSFGLVLTHLLDPGPRSRADLSSSSFDTKSLTMTEVLKKKRWVLSLDIVTRWAIQKNRPIKKLPISISFLILCAIHEVKIVGVWQKCKKFRLLIFSRERSPLFKMSNFSALLNVTWAYFND